MQSRKNSRLIDDLVRSPHAFYKKNIVRALQGPSQHDKTFSFEAVHEGSMIIPVLLTLHAARAQPSRAMAANNREQLLHLVTETP